jgi:hypothetical protein
MSEQKKIIHYSLELAEHWSAPRAPCGAIVITSVEECARALKMSPA